jgi:hypothetical protein
MPIVDFETVLPEDFGASLKGLGVNLLVRDVALELAFLETVFEIKGIASVQILLSSRIGTTCSNFMRMAPIIAILCWVFCQKTRPVVQE